VSTWFSGNVGVNNIRLHFYRTGGGDKPSPVLVHGLTDNGLCWTRTAEALEKEYDLIMLDARGHGRSDAPLTGYTPEDRAADLAGLIEALGLDHPCLIGHSMGADTVAFTTATYPHLVRGVILEDPPWYAGLSSTQSREASASEWRAKMLERKSKSMPALIAAVQQEHPDWAEIEFGTWAEAKLQASLNVLQMITELRSHWRETVAKITRPALLLTGDPALGGLVTAEVASEAARRCPYLQVAHLGGAGHSIRREQFGQFMNQMTTFLAAL
jgi:pimeloyl-ACP methyl ester carboxylesterase